MLNIRQELAADQFDAPSFVDKLRSQGNLVLLRANVETIKDQANDELITAIHEQCSAVIHPITKINPRDITTVREKLEALTEPFTEYERLMGTHRAKIDATKAAIHHSNDEIKRAMFAQALFRSVHTLVASLDAPEPVDIDAVTSEYCKLAKTVDQATPRQGHPLRAALRDGKGTLVDRILGQTIVKADVSDEDAARAIQAVVRLGADDRLLSTLTQEISARMGDADTMQDAIKAITPVLASPWFTTVAAASVRLATTADPDMSIQFHMSHAMLAAMKAVKRDSALVTVSTESEMKQFERDYMSAHAYLQTLHGMFARAAGTEGEIETFVQFAIEDRRMHDAFMSCLLIPRHRVDAYYKQKQLAAISAFEKKLEMNGIKPTNNTFIFDLKTEGPRLLQEQLERVFSDHITPDPMRGTAPQLMAHYVSLLFAVVDQFSAWAQRLKGREPDAKLTLVTDDVQTLCTAEGVLSVVKGRIAEAWGEESARKVVEAARSRMLKGVSFY
ncbi:hypothetical protein J8273_8203 [Carpediemonas membranifera]|uniref:Uncharacterized protein n=1 Tax=Carpediemonas membranifera TaxID=201153 RepID=A0A8J6APX0_9EUKA|nr:hypothetical protein J8273_8203 [Carpediemonas membranifera]|eukprot:KAG9390163.1 hypothetical protein J8273_8203 [Carpediemonas membranifera]